MSGNPVSCHQADYKNLLHQDVSWLQPAVLHSAHLVAQEHKRSGLFMGVERCNTRMLFAQQKKGTKKV